VEKTSGFETVIRFRVGDYRIIYEIHDAVLLVSDSRVGDRKESTVNEFRGVNKLIISSTIPPRPRGMGFAGKITDTVRRLSCVNCGRPRRLVKMLRRSGGVFHRLAEDATGRLFAGAGPESGSAVRMNGCTAVARLRKIIR